MNFILTEDIENKEERWLDIVLTADGYLSVNEEPEIIEIIKDNIWTNNRDDICNEAVEMLKNILPSVFPESIQADMESIDIADDNFNSMGSSRDFNIELYASISYFADKELSEEELSAIKSRLHDKLIHGGKETSISYSYEYDYYYTPAKINAPAEDCYPEESGFDKEGTDYLALDVSEVTSVTDV